jgi:ketopantoate reductase
VLKGVLKAGWGLNKDQDLTVESSDEKEEIKQELAQQTLSLLSGQNAKCEKPDKIATFFGDDQKQSGSMSFNRPVVTNGFSDSNLAKADENPILLEIAEFDTEKHPDLKDKRWEKWVTAMSYDQSTMMYVAQGV